MTAPSKRASVAWRLRAIFASSAGVTSKRARLLSAHSWAWGAKVREAASAMCSGARTGSSRSRSHSPGGSRRSSVASSSTSVTGINVSAARCNAAAARAAGGRGTLSALCDGR